MFMFRQVPAGFIPRKESPVAPLDLDVPLSYRLLLPKLDPNKKNNVKLAASFYVAKLR